MSGAIVLPWYLPGARLCWWGFPHNSVGKESACNVGDLGSIPGSGRSPGEGNGNPLQYSCLENHMDRGAWQVTVHGVARVRHDLATKLLLNYGGGNGDNGDLLQKIPCMYCYTQCPQPCSKPPATHISTGDSWTLTKKSGSVSCGVTAPFSWVLVHKVLCVPSMSISQPCIRGLIFLTHL